MKPLRVGAGVLAVLALAPSPAGLAQAPPRRLEFPSSVTLVSFPVFVTDKAGRSVTGLALPDFVVEDQGRPVTLVGLQEVDALAPLRPAGNSVGAAAARRQFLILFDTSFTNLNGLVRAQEAIVRLLKEGLGPADLVAAATLSVRSGFKLLVGFTSDRAQVAAALRNMGSPDPERKSDLLGLLYNFGVEDAWGPASASESARKDAISDILRTEQVLFRRQNEAEYRHGVGALLKGIRQLARVLDAVQGRKQILYLSAGFDESVLVGEQGAQAQASGEAVIDGRLWEVDSENRFGDTGIRQQLDGMLRLLTGADVVVHTIDVAGLAARGDIASLQEVGQSQLGVGRESLSQIAQGTGGRFIKDTNDLGKGLAEILDSTRRFYVLAFEPGSLKGPGTFHRLKVRVKDKTVNVSARRGYLEGALDASKNPLAPRFQAAEAIAKGLTGGGIRLAALAVPYRTAAGQSVVSVVLEVDGSSLLDRPAAPELPLEIYGYAMAEDGRVEDLVSLSSTLRLDKLGDALKQNGLHLQTAFALQPGKHSLRFLVRDAATGRQGFQILEASMSGFETGFLLPPLLMDDPGRWLVVQTPSHARAPLETPFRVATDLFTPRVRASLANGRASSFCVLAFEGAPQGRPGPSSFDIRTQLVNAQGASVPLGPVELVKSVAEPDGFRRFLLKVTPGGVPPGEYTFKVRLLDADSRPAGEAQQTVFVE